MRRWLPLLAVLLVYAPSAQAQNYTLAPDAEQAFKNATGLNPCSGCKLYTYQAGTTTPLDTYVTSSGTVNLNPIVLNSAGRNPAGGIYLSSNSYKFKLTTSAGVEIWTRDGVSAVPGLSSGITSTGDLTFQVDTDSNGSNKFTFLDGAGVERAQINETGALQIDGDLTVGDGTAADKKILFDGATTDFHVGLDDSATSLVIGKGSVLGTTPAITIDNTPAVTVNAAATFSSATTFSSTATFSGAIKATSSSAFAPTGTFRNLQLRTHPDADIAAKTVELIHADEIVADDGTRFSDVNLLTADITASGAAGLDTSTEAASTWYETYFIAKDDGTKSLVLHLALNYSKDTSFETADNNGRLLRLATSTATDKLAQGIQFSNSGALNFIDVILNRNNAVTGRIWYSIQADSSGSPSGTPLSTSDKMDVSTISTSTQSLRFVFRSPFTVSASTQYHLVMEGDYTRSDTINIGWRGVTAGGYASGSAKEYNGATWSAATPADFSFKAYITRNSAAVSMPTGYTKKALIGYVYNNSGSDFVLFTARDRKVTTLASVAALSTTANAFQTLADAAVYLPPVPLRAWLVLSNNTGGDGAAAAGVPDGYMGTSVRAGGAVRVYPASATTGSAAEVYIMTEYQGVYFDAESGGTATVNVTGFEW